jgi:hypothetical protein
MDAVLKKSREPRAFGCAVRDVLQLRAVTAPSFLLGAVAAFISLLIARKVRSREDFAGPAS